MTATYRITTGRIHFENLIHSHGWRALAPFTWNEEARSLSRPICLANGSHVSVAVREKRRQDRSNIEIETERKLNPNERVEVRQQVRRMLSLDEDLSEFHSVCRVDPLLRFVYRNRSGRMLRAPTAFEDLIKTICTTNCSWQNTKKMCKGLCELAGGCFPEPKMLLKLSPTKLADRVPVGYRSKTILTVARMTENGELPLDEWAAMRNFQLIKTTLKDIWGIGPYALGHMLMLLGDYSAIPVDCEVLKYLQLTHFGGRKVSAKDAVIPYASYERFQFLAFQLRRIRDR